MDANNKKHARNSEKGQAIALMVLALTALIAMVALAVDGGRLYYAERTAQNAADNASLSGALARCQNTSITTAAFNSAAINGFNNDGTSNTVTVNSPPLSGPNTGDWEYVEVTVNSVQQPGFAQIIYSGSLETTVRATANCDLQLSFDHALFAGATSCANSVIWGSSNVDIVGGVHTNGNLLMSGSSNTIEGTVSYADTINGTTGNVTYDPPPPDNPELVPVQAYPVPYQMADYVPGGSSALAAGALGQYYYLNGTMDVAYLQGAGLMDGSGNMADGLYYATGPIELLGNNAYGPNVTFVSRDDITLSGANHDLSYYIDGLLFFTDHQNNGGSACALAVVNLSGSVNSWSGVIYAPNGRVEMSGSNATTFSGSIFAAVIALSGSNISITTDQSLLPAPPPQLNLAE